MSRLRQRLARSFYDLALRLDGKAIKQDMVDATKEVLEDANDLGGINLENLEMLRLKYQIEELGLKP